MKLASLFDCVVGMNATLNYNDCKLLGVILETCWIAGELHYHIQFPDIEKTKSGRIKHYHWSAIYPQDYVIIRN